MAGRIESLSSQSRSIVNSLRETQRSNDRASDRLATGRRVNRIEQDPQVFALARQLLDRAADLGRYVDGSCIWRTTISSA